MLSEPEEEYGPAQHEFAWRFAQAREEQDTETLNRLFRDFPEYSPLTAVAWLLTDDGTAGAAVSHLRDWLAKDIDAGANSVLALLHNRLRWVISAETLDGNNADTLLMVRFRQLKQDQDTLAALTAILDTTLLSLVACEALPYAALEDSRLKLAA